MTTHELMKEFRDLMDRRDQAMERIDGTEVPAAEDMAEYEAAEKAIATWLQESAPEKLAALLAVKDKRKADARYRREESKRWTAMAKAADRDVSWLEHRALWILDVIKQTTGNAKVTMPGGRTATVKVRQTQRVEIADVESLPAEYVRVKREPNKTAIKSAIKDGADIDGAQMVTTESAYVSVRS